MMLLTVREAARLLGCSEDFIREGLKQERLPIGTAVKMDRWVFRIDSRRVADYLEVKEKTVEMIVKDLRERSA